MGFVRIDFRVHNPPLKVLPTARNVFFYALQDPMDVASLVRPGYTGDATSSEIQWFKFKLNGFSLIESLSIATSTAAVEDKSIS